VDCALTFNWVELRDRANTLPYRAKGSVPPPDADRADEPPGSSLLAGSAGELRWTLRAEHDGCRVRSWQKRTSRDVRSLVAIGVKADMAVTSADFRV
jgi:hypothetical protein